MDEEALADIFICSLRIDRNIERGQIEVSIVTVYEEATYPALINRIF